MPARRTTKPEYTPRQGQFLALIYYYTKVNGCPPAEDNMTRRSRLAAFGCRSGTIAGGRC